MQEFVGQAAALATAALFALSSTFFTIAGRRVGSTTVNRARLLVATAFAMALHWVSFGVALPFGAPSRGWLWLGLSGVLGLTLGDALLFRSFVLVGPAIAMLVFASTPVIAALLGFAVLGEALTPIEWVAIAFTISGIAWVVTEPKRRTFLGGTRSYVAGIFLAAGGAAGQALGLTTAKLGLAEGVVAQSGNLMRLLAATLAIWILPALTGGLRRTALALRSDRRASAAVVAGSVVGPVLGVWLSLVAIERAPIGIASTLMSLTPVFLLPVARIVFAEPISARAVLGTVVALAGAALLFR